MFVVACPFPYGPDQCLQQAVGSGLLPVYAPVRTVKCTVHSFQKEVLGCCCVCTYTACKKLSTDHAQAAWCSAGNERIRFL